MITKLRIVEDDRYQKPIGFSIALKRLAAYPVGALFLGLGFWMAFWDAKSRTWHDKFSGSIVRRLK